MTTTWPAYEGSVHTSCYRVCLVFTTRSPPAATGAPNATPGNTVPSSSASNAGPRSPIRGSTTALVRGAGGTGRSITWPRIQRTHRPRGLGGQTRAQTWMPPSPASRDRYASLTGRAMKGRRQGSIRPMPTQRGGSALRLPGEGGKKQVDEQALVGAVGEVHVRLAVTAVIGVEDGLSDGPLAGRLDIYVNERRRDDGRVDDRRDGQRVVDGRRVRALHRLGPVVALDPPLREQRGSVAGGRAERTKSGAVVERDECLVRRIERDEGDLPDAAAEDRARGLGIGPHVE